MWMQRIKTTFLLILLTSAIGCAYHQKNDFYTLNAKLKNTTKNNDNNGNLDDEFVIKGHRISHGNGSIIAVREYHESGGPIKLHGGSFKKLTVYFPENIENLSGKINFKENEGMIAYFSIGSSSYPGHSGCHGYAKDGSIELQWQDKKLQANINLRFDLESPLGWKNECKPFIYQENLTLKKKTVSGLTSWEGKSAPEIYDESIPYK